MNGHYDESVLQEYHDGVLGDADREALRAHLAKCRTCATLDARVIAFDQALRMIPLEQPGLAFTSRVLARIDRRGATDWLDRVLEPRIIAGTTVALFGIAGTVNAILLSQAGRADAGSTSRWGASLDAIAGGIASGPYALASWLTSFLPQVFSHGALQVSLAVVLLVPLFLCADRILAKRRVMG
jgi:anti-sigma factor RsiW